MTSTYNRGVSLGSVLRSRRRLLGLEQEEVAERIGVEQQTVSRWENDEARPRVARLADISQVLELPESELRRAYLASNDGSPEPAEEIAELRAELSSLQRLVERLADDVRRAVSPDTSPGGSTEGRGK